MKFIALYGDTTTKMQNKEEYDVNDMKTAQASRCFNQLCVHLFCKEEFLERDYRLNFSVFVHKMTTQLLSYYLIYLKYVVYLFLYKFGKHRLKIVFKVSFSMSLKN